jgi:hypothetical protein
MSPDGENIISQRLIAQLKGGSGMERKVIWTILIGIILFGAVVFILVDRLPQSSHGTTSQPSIQPTPTPQIVYVTVLVTPIQTPQTPNWDYPVATTPKPTATAPKITTQEVSTSVGMLLEEVHEHGEDAARFKFTTVKTGKVSILVVCGGPCKAVLQSPTTKDFILLDGVVNHPFVKAQVVNLPTVQTYTVVMSVEHGISWSLDITNA